MTIESIHKEFLSSSGICTDTRKLIKDQIFIALKGPNFNANELAAEALEKGAKKAIVDDENFCLDNNKYIYVQDGLKALQDLATFHRRFLNTPLIGITGSNGKTTTKELIYHVLSKKFNVLATSGNFNNHIGVPLTLLNLTKAHDLGIIEMGANHVGEIAELCSIAEINYGLITSIGKAHLEGFGSVENIKKTKRAVYDYCVDHNGMCFVNESIEDVRVLYKGNASQLISYGINGKIEIKDIESSDDGIKITIENNQKIYKIQSQLFGTYNAQNILSSLAIGQHFNVNMEDMKSAIANYSSDNNRSQVKYFRGGKIIMDAYNANPTSMQLAIKSLSQDKVENKLLILGDMAELGAESEKEHLEILKIIKELNLSAITIGPIFAKADNSKQCTNFINIQEAIDFLKTMDFSNKLVLVKGSRSMALEKLFEQ